MTIETISVECVCQGDLIGFGDRWLKIGNIIKNKDIVLIDMEGNIRRCYVCGRLLRRNV